MALTGSSPAVAPNFSRAKWPIGWARLAESGLDAPEDAKLGPPDPQHHALADVGHDAGEGGDIDLVCEHHGDAWGLAGGHQGQGCLGLARALRRRIKERVEGCLVDALSRKGEVGCLAGTAPLRTPNGLDSDATALKSRAYAKRLGAPLGAQVALGCAVTERKPHGVCRAGCECVAKQHKGSGLDALPSVVSAGLQQRSKSQCAKGQAAREAAPSKQPSHGDPGCLIGHGDETLPVTCSSLNHRQ